MHGCESHFEELVRNAEQAVVCPECGAANVLKQLSTFAFTGTSSQASFGAGCRRRLLRRLLRLRLEHRLITIGRVVVASRGAPPRRQHEV